MEKIEEGMTVYHRVTDEPMYVLYTMGSDDDGYDYAKVRRAAHTPDIGIQYREDEFRVGELYTRLTRAREDALIALRISELREELTSPKGTSRLQ